MEFLQITKSYYSKWLGLQKNLADLWGVHWIYCPERNLVQQGYSAPFALYAWKQDHKFIISYGDQAKDRMELLQEQVGHLISAKDFKNAAESVLSCKCEHHVKFVLQTVPLLHENDKVKTLTPEDFDAYRRFFQKGRPECRDTGWLEAYFKDMTAAKTCVGYFEGEELASCTDAPDMPYMPNKAQEIGVFTLPEYRGRGYGTKVCAQCVHNILESRRCPQWSADSENIPSHKLAYKIGFVKLADVVTASL